MIEKAGRDEVTIYTDGACSGNPGPGGWGVVLSWRESERTLQGGEAATTNNRMELTAAIRGLETLKWPCNVVLKSDSAYLINAFNQGWLKKWEGNGWINAKKEPVENQDLWFRLLELAEIHRIKWEKVKGHGNDPYNIRCDAMAVEEAGRRKGVAPD